MINTLKTCLKEKKRKYFKWLAATFLAFIALIISLNILLFAFCFSPGSVVIVMPNFGIGNQFFRYAAAYSLAKSTGSKLIVTIESTAEDGENINSKTRKSFLNKFNITYDGQFNYHFLQKRALKLVKYKVIRAFLLYDIKMVGITNFHQFTKYYNKGVMILDDIFESEIFFRQYKDDILNLLNADHLISVKTAALSTKLKERNSVCVHVRRGDFGESHRKTHFMPIEYQQQAMKIASRLIPDAKFYIFSDDIKLARQELGEDNRFDFVSGPNFTPLDDLALMSQCKNIITANSTFSWWAAYLGDKNRGEDRLVISPYPFNNEELLNTVNNAESRFLWKRIVYNGITPKNWVQLAYNQKPLSMTAKEILPEQEYKKIFANYTPPEFYIYSGDLAQLKLCENGDFKKGLCYLNNDLTPKPTVVTAYYQIPNKHGHENYLNWAKNFLSIPFNLVIFTDKQNAAWIKEMRGNLPMVLIEKEFDEFYYFRFFDVFKNYKKYSPELYLLWNEKVKFVNEAITANHYDASYFLWCDFGIFRDTHYIDHTFPDAKYIWRDKMTFGMINDFSAKERQEQLMVSHEKVFRALRKLNRTQGGIQLGDVTAWKLYNYLYDKTFLDMIAEGEVITQEQRIIGTVALRYPWMVRLQYPDVRFQGNLWWYLLLYYTKEHKKIMD